MCGPASGDLRHASGRRGNPLFKTHKAFGRLKTSAVKMQMAMEKPDARLPNLRSGVVKNFYLAAKLIPI